VSDILTMQDVADREYWKGWRDCKVEIIDAMFDAIQDDEFVISQVEESIKKRRKRKQERDYLKKRLFDK
jgi:hypothetical protein